MDYMKKSRDALISAVGTSFFKRIVVVILLILPFMQVLMYVYTCIYMLEFVAFSALQGPCYILNIIMKNYAMWCNKKVLKKIQKQKAQRQPCNLL